MKGLIFNSLADLIELEHGIVAWNSALSRIDSICDGAYVSTDTYPPSEMLALVTELAAELDLPPATLLDKFGHTLFQDLYNLYPELVDKHTELIPFLASVGGEIHGEMKVLYSDAEVPAMHHELHDRNSIKVYYQSPRRLCLLAEGIMRGAALHFDTRIELEHQGCMHDGEECCTFVLRLVD